MKALVTGGAGFLGSHIVDRLVADGYKVTVIDDLSAGRRNNLPPKVRLVKKAVAKMSKNDVAGVDVVVHCAAQVSTFLSVDYPAEDFERNAHSTFHLFETCRKHNDKALILCTSSRSVLGNIAPPALADEAFPYNPSTFYNVHKIYSELLCKIYSELYGMKSVVLRPSNVYGPRQPYWKGGWYNFIAFWIRLALEAKPIPIYGTGEQIRDYTYVADAVDAFMLALHNPRAVGETFLLPSGRGVSLNELAGLVRSQTNSKSELEYLPARKGDIARFVGSSAKAARILGWRTKISLEDGLAKEIEWVGSTLGKSSKGRRTR